MARELLPATFASEERAARWARGCTHPSIVQEDTRVVPSKTKRGRFQVLINRKAAPAAKPDEEVQS